MVTVVAIVGFVLLYEVSMFDSRDAAPRGIVDPTLPAAGTRQLFTATAYCKGTTTASGVGVRTGIAASDPGILPVGSVINISAGNTKYNGVYTIMDTGPKVQGRLIDLYMWSCHEALRFGRQPIDVTVLRLGWNPSASTPSLIDRLFRRREATRTAVPAASTNGVEGASTATGASDGATGANSAEAVREPADLAPVTAPSDLAPSDAPLPSSPSSPVAPAANPPR